MENQDLLEALDFLDPGNLTYEEWTIVGMGLKQAGYPVTSWEQWSARDGGRYHRGECARKWGSFRGNPNPVTENSIFKLARDHGWGGPAGHALDWNDVIDAPAAKTEGRVVDPHWKCRNWLSPPIGTPPTSWYATCRPCLSRRNTWPT